MMDRWAFILFLVFSLVPSLRGVTTKSAKPSAEAATTKGTTSTTTAKTTTSGPSGGLHLGASTTTTTTPCNAFGKNVTCNATLCEKCTGLGCRSRCKSCETCHAGKCVYDIPGYCYAPGRLKCSKCNKKCETCIAGECVVNPGYCHNPGFGKCYTPGFNRHHGDKERPNGYDRCNMLCDPTKDRTRMPHAPVGTPCDDGYFCTSGSVCVNTADGLNVECMAKSKVKTGPCTKSFCKSSCNEAARRCESPCNSTCRSKAICTEADGRGTCETVPIDSPPSCTTCPCDRGMTCNKTSGQCFVPPSTTMRPRTTKHSDKGFMEAEYFVPSVIGGVVGGTLVIIVVVIVLCVIKKKRIENFELRTVYHKVNGQDAETQIINKGL